MSCNVKNCRPSKHQTETRRASSQASAQNNLEPDEGNLAFQPFENAIYTSNTSLTCHSNLELHSLQSPPITLLCMLFTGITCLRSIHRARAPVHALAIHSVRGTPIAISTGNAMPCHHMIFPHASVMAKTRPPWMM